LCGVRIESDRTVERGIETNLGETDVGGLLTEALTADVHLKPSVLATYVHVMPHIAIRNMFEGWFLLTPYLRIRPARWEQTRLKAHKY
jgi:hypothetical protein